MGYGSKPGEKSVVSNISSAGRNPKTGCLLPSSSINSSQIASIGTSSKGVPFVQIAQSILNQPTRTPGGAGISISPVNSSSNSSPGFVSNLVTSLTNPSSVPGYVSANEPGSVKLSGAVGTTAVAGAAGGAAMGLLDTAKTYLSSSSGKQILGGATAALTGGSTTTTTSRAINPRTGKPYRRMDPLNVKAVRRATRRLNSFTHTTHSVEKALRKLMPHKR